MSIYVEILMHTDMDTLWEVHADAGSSCALGFTLQHDRLSASPGCRKAAAVSLLHSYRLWDDYQRQGETVGSREDNGCRTSALKFWSDDARSLIREGSGYWQYVPTPEGIRFLTQYTYQTRFGWLGHWFDRLVFRPLMGWATAWSFDRLRLWLEKGIDPAISLERSILHSIVRLTLAFIWIYQGVFPKLLFRDTGELAILQHSHLFSGHEPVVLSLVGSGEIAFGGLLVWRWYSRTSCRSTLCCWSSWEPEPCSVSRVSLLRLSIRSR